MLDLTGNDATVLVPTGAGDLVEQLNRAARRHLWWPWLAAALGLLVVLTLAAPPIAIAVLVLGIPVVVWLRLWEQAKRTVIAFYEVEGPAADWFEQLTSGYHTLTSMGGTWRLLSSGRLTGTHQRKINSGAAYLVGRSRAFFAVGGANQLTTNISVPSLVCGPNALLFLPDRVLVRSGRRWSDVMYGDLRVTAKPTRFIESGGIPRDARQVGATWKYVNVNGGPDRRFSNNRQLPVMEYGTLELTSLAGLHWVVDCSRADVAMWFAHLLVRPSVFVGTPAMPSAMPQTLPAGPIKIVSSRPAKSAYAEPGRREGIFAYALPKSDRSSGFVHDGPFAVVDVETTGFSPETGDRVIEIAVARVDPRGVIEDEFATLVNPGRRDTGAVFIHGIAPKDVAGAPTFQEIAAEVSARLEGCVIVAHNAAFEERFLAAEFARAGVRLGPLPALCTLWLGQQTFDTPNHKLGTLAKAVGIATPDAHAALGDVRVVAALLPQMLSRYQYQLCYPCEPLAASPDKLPPNGVRLRTRAVALRQGDRGWMSTLLARLPMSASEAGDADSERYLSMLSTALEDGRIVGDEARALAALAGTAGLGSLQVASLNQRFLESMREAAFADDVLTESELKTLRTAAKALGIPDYFDDLAPTDRRIGKDLPSTQAPPRQKRCGNCRETGHYRSRCPELALVT